MSGSPPSIDPADPAAPAPNRLIHETSPYLRQHARNPVDWYPWGAEAHETAQRLDRPIFLSIGYSACHWCHVMEHESFEDEAIARLMNAHFVNIKVDREERPDLDQIYMNAVQLMNRRGGWPMSVFLTPDLKPFYGGTYWPPHARGGMPGFAQILTAIAEAWRLRRTEIEDQAEHLTGQVRLVSAPELDPSPLSEELLRQAQQKLIEVADRTAGGFGSAPKFPHAMDLRVLLRTARRFGNNDALAVVRLTLDKMAGGGIYDHLGGGFHRYSTDARWLVPHFEKMLYDNALLVPAYLEAYQVTGETGYARVARESLDYVLREMTQPHGGFYSTQDADSEGVEGKYFVWTEAEICEVLSAEHARVFSACYDVTPRGNWEGQTVLNRPESISRLSKALQIDADELERILDHCRRKLLEIRSRRIAPARDDKVLVSWNGMMLSAMALGARVLGEPRYEAAARATADFLLSALRQPDGRLWHSYKDGQARFNACIDDYACLVDGLVDVYQATFDPKYLEAAVELADSMIALFRDSHGGGFHYTSSDHEHLLVRAKDTSDGATPSGNSMAATALLRLGRLTGRRDFEDQAVATLTYLSGILAQSPTAGGQALLALDFLLGPSREIVLVDGSDSGDTERVLRELNRRFLPNVVVARKRTGQSDEALLPLRSLVAGREPAGAGCTIFVCTQETCAPPVQGVAGLKQILNA